MSVLVYAESIKGKFKKAAFEVVSYGKQVANIIGGDCNVVVLGEVDELSTLSQYGADKIYHLSESTLNNFDSQLYTQVIAQLQERTNTRVIVMSHSSSGKSLIGRLSVKLNAGSVSGVNSLPSVDDGFRVKKTVFSSKAIAEFQINSEIKVLSLTGNSVPIEKFAGAGEIIEVSDISLSEGSITVEEVKTVDGKVPLPEAELVVSAGRGMKGPENWSIIEELADALGATTACSRPVADTGWRPHHEHVGQTGVAIRPNLYIAAGISGAIQHLAGVNNSKCIVVINKDPEAPFFKAADYGVVGDLFEVVPKLTEAVKKFKASN